MYCIGIMSGTSLDGVDACLVEIKRKFFKTTYNIKGFIYLRYEKEFKTKLYNISINKHITIQKVCSLNVEVSNHYCLAVKKLLSDHNLKPKDIEFIAMHGQTVWHNPDQRDGYESSTLQLGEPAILAAAFGCKVVSNFRAMDMAVGGSGAPLVPYANMILFRSKTENIALQNIGGIGNVTFLKKNCKAKDIIAFDTGPGNMLIDGAMKRLFNKDFDDGGKYALKGHIIDSVLDDLMKDPYLYHELPKSTGREKYNEGFLSEVILKLRSAGANDYDIITTLSAYTADTILFQYQKFLPKIDRMVISGGGAFNEFIVERIREKIPCKVEIDKNFESLEALSFAILGYCTIKKIPSNVPSVTGAKKAVVLGDITHSPF